MSKKIFSAAILISAAAIALLLACSNDGGSGVLDPRQLPALTVNRSPAEGGVVTVNGYTTGGVTPHSPGMSVKVCAVAASGYEFTGWSGASTSTDSCVSISMNASLTLTAAFQRLPPKCGGVEYDTLTRFCANDATYPLCGGKKYIPNTQFCVDTTVYQKCADAEYDINKKVCVNNQLRTKCGSGHFDPDTEFCTGNGMAFPKCGGNEYDLDEEFCNDNAVYKKCNGQTYTPPDNPCDIRPLSIIVSPAGSGSVQRDPHQQSYLVGTTVALKAVPESGFEFINWVGAPASVENITSAEITFEMTDAVTLTANFQQEFRPSLTINRNPAVGGVVSEYESSYAVGTEITVTATASADYEFVGWDGAPATVNAANPTITFVINNNTTLIANFRNVVTTPATHTLSVSANPSAGGSVSHEQNYNAGMRVTLTAVPNTGYRFVDWAGDLEGTEPGLSFTINSDMTLTANFELIPRYTLTINREPQAGGEVSRNPNQQDYEEGTTVMVTATPNANAGYEFIGWTGDAVSAERELPLRIDSNMTITANFGRIYTLTVNGSPNIGGAVSPEGTTQRSDGASVTITALPANGYEFINWTGIGIDDPNSATTTVTIDGNKTVTANFRRITYTLTVTAGTGGTVSPSGASTRGSDTTINVCATPTVAANEYRFTGWSGASTSTEPCVAVTMDGNKSLTANFQLVAFTDTRSGGQRYRVVRIGNQTWMAENLNYVTDSSWCYGNDASNCVKYGRLYAWNPAMTACPAGWRLPSQDDWNVLMAAVGGVYFEYPSGSGEAIRWDFAGTKLKSKTGWDNQSDGTSGNGTDEFGFSALPGGLLSSTGIFSHIGTNGFWQSATRREHPEYDNLRSWRMGHNSDKVHLPNIGKSNGMSVRCVMGN